MTFDMESFDVKTKAEALFTGIELANYGAYGAALAGTETFDFQGALPLDITSPWKSARSQYDVTAGVIVPYLTLQSATYRFGVGQSSTQSFTLNGDSYYMVQGAPIWERFTLVGGTTTYNLGNTAVAYSGNGTTQFVVSAKVINPTTGLYKRLFFEPGVASTDSFEAPTNAAVTVGNDWFAEGYTYLDVCYGTSDAVTMPQAIHESDTTLKPAAVRGKDVAVQFSLDNGTTYETFRFIQSFEVTWQANAEQLNELGNSQSVETDFDTPTVSGTINVRVPSVDDAYELFTRISGVTAGEIVGPDVTQQLPLRAIISHPDTGVVQKSLEISDARITLPPINAQVQQAVDLNLTFNSDSGNLLVAEGTF